MAALLTTYDLPGAEQLEAYGKWALNTVEQVIVKIPGLVEFRAYRDAFRNSPQVTTIYEFDSLNSALQYVNSETYVNTFRDAEAHGCRNFKVQLVNTSPIVRGPVRPSS